MEILCQDVLKHITSFANESDVYSMSRTSKDLAEIVEESHLHFEGPPNGHTFSQKTLRLNGVVYMPYVQFINLYGFVNEDLHILDFIGPQSPTVRSKWKPEISFHTDLKIPRNITYSHATIYGNGFVSIAAEEVYCNPETYNMSEFFKLRRLIMYSYNSVESGEDAKALIKAFSSNLQSLELMGLLTDVNMIRLPQSKTLKRIFLHYQSFCSWEHVRSFQLSCPNIEIFGLLSSSLIDSDIFKFDWTLWPNLTTLNFSQNYIIQNYPDWPEKLTELTLGYCHTDCLPLNLISLAVIIDNIGSLREYMKEAQKTLKHLKLTLTMFLKEDWTLDEFWDYCHDLNTIHFEFKELFGKDKIRLILQVIRKRFPNILITA